VTVPCPTVEWPSFLEECGPAEDPSILLRGTARIGGTRVAVVAIRIKPELRRAPDYRQDVPSAAYETGALDTMLEEFEYLTDELTVVAGGAGRSIVRLQTGPYVMGVLPAG